MKTFPRFAAVALALPLAFSPALPGRAADKLDFSLIEKLPAREVAAKKTAHEGWDTGTTSKMLASTNTYNDTLTAMMTELATTYYGKAKLTKEEVAGYVKALKITAEFRHRVDNPTNEDRGTEDALEAPNLVSNDLEDTVEQMVGAVSDSDDHFDFAGWQKRWNEAKQTGDETEEKSGQEPATKAEGDKAVASPSPAETPEKSTTRDKSN